MLKELGLTEYEAKAYIALIMLGEGSVREISELSKVPASKLYEVLSKLEERGFILSSYGRPMKYIARDPEETLNSIRYRYDKLITTLSRDLKSIWRTHRRLSKITFVRDLNDIMRKIRSMLNEASSIVKIIVDECSLWVEYGLLENLASLISNNIEVRIILNPRCRYLDEFRNLVGNRVRISDKANFLCVIKDLNEVLKGITGNEPVVIIYNIREIVDLINEIFDSIWSQGIDKKSL